MMVVAAIVPVAVVCTIAARHHRAMEALHGAQATMRRGTTRHLEAPSACVAAIALSSFVWSCDRMSSVLA